MNVVFLDKESLHPHDLDFSPITKLDISYMEYQHTNNDQINERTTNATIIICNKVVINNSIISRAHELKMIIVTATGVNNIDLDSAKKHGVIVCNIADYSTESVAQHTLTLMLTSFNRLIDYSNDVTAGLWQQSSQFCLLNHNIHQLQGKTLGIIGYGTIAKRLCELVAPFNMTILIAQSLTEKPTANDAPFPRISLDELLIQADVLSIHCPLTPKTKHLLHYKNLSTMKKSAVLINTSRGGIINESDLARLLLENKLGGAGLDVLEHEPPHDNHPLLKEQIPNLILTPHCAWGSRDSRQSLITHTSIIIKSYCNNSQD